MDLNEYKFEALSLLWLDLKTVIGAMTIWHIAYHKVPNVQTTSKVSK